MSDRTREPEIQARPPVPSAHIEGAEAAPQKLPYEAPKLLKKRSVAGATLGTPMGPTSIAMTGN